MGLLPHIVSADVDVQLTTKRRNVKAVAQTEPFIKLTERGHGWENNTCFLLL